MAKRKFYKKAFREWLDCLAKVIVKNRDDFTCQIRHDSECSGKMEPLDFNCQWVHIKSRKSNNLRWSLFNTICGCGHCHTWAHDNPNEFGVWFATKYPQLDQYLNLPRKSYTWYESDFRLVERQLLQKAIDLDVDYMTVPDRGRGYRNRFIKKIKEMRGKDAREE